MLHPFLTNCKSVLSDHQQETCVMLLKNWSLACCVTWQERNHPTQSVSFHHQEGNQLRTSVNSNTRHRIKGNGLKDRDCYLVQLTSLVLSIWLPPSSHNIQHFSSLILTSTSPVTSYLRFISCSLLRCTSSLTNILASQSSDCPTPFAQLPFAKSTFGFATIHTRSPRKTAWHVFTIWAADVHNRSLGNNVPCRPHTIPEERFSFKLKTQFCDFVSPGCLDNWCATSQHTVRLRS